MKQQIENLLTEAKRKVAAAEGENIDHLTSIIQLLQSTKWRLSQLTEQPKKDLSGAGQQAWKYLYPLYATDFLYGSNYEKFAQLISENFILSAEQWGGILTEWELKEFLLTEKTPTND
jgi:hypothetical protein